MHLRGSPSKKKNKLIVHRLNGRKKNKKKTGSIRTALVLRLSSCTVVYAYVLAVRSCAGVSRVKATAPEGGRMEGWGCRSGTYVDVDGRHGKNSRIGQLLGHESVEFAATFVPFEHVERLAFQVVAALESDALANPHRHRHLDRNVLQTFRELGPCNRRERRPAFKISNLISRPTKRLPYMPTRYRYLFHPSPPSPSPRPHSFFSTAHRMVASTYIAI